MFSNGGGIDFTNKLPDMNEGPPTRIINDGPFSSSVGRVAEEKQRRQ
jgi:hypothetical protein